MADYQRSISRTRTGLQRLTADLAIVSGGVVFVLYWLAQISLRGLLEFYPGLGALLVLGVVLGVPQAFMKAAMRSHLNRGSSSRTEER